MSSTSRYTMLGEHFAREFILGNSDIISKDSLNLYRINPISSYKFDTSFNSENTIQIKMLLKDRQEVVLKRNLKKFQDVVDQKVTYIEYAFSSITKINNEEISVTEIQPEKIITGKKGHKLLKYYKVDTNSILDSLYLNPIIPEDKVAWEINDRLFSLFTDQLSDDTDMIIISGEMIWSGWVSFASILKLLVESKLNRKLIIIDNWGYLQQRFSMDSNKIPKEDSLLINNLENLATSIFLESDKKVHDYKEQIDINTNTLTMGLFSNRGYSRTMKNGFEHKPDYIFFPQKVSKGKKFTNKFDISLGIKSLAIKPLQAVFLGKGKIHFHIPYETLIQKSIGENVEYGEDIGQYPETESLLLGLKFANRFTQSVKNWQLVNKGDVIGEKKVLKNFLREKVVAPVKGRVDNRYLPWGMLSFRSVEAMSTFRAPFEGKLMSLKKINNRTEIRVHAESITIPITYMKGPEVEGIIVSIVDMKTSAEGEKILLLRKSDISQVSKEDIVKYNIVGFVLLDADYQLIKEFSKEYLHNSKNINVSLVLPLSGSTSNTITDIFYLMSGRRVVINEKKIHILIDKRSKKELYLRMNSGKDSSQGTNLIKGDYVYYLNYKHNYMYARIEKVKPENVVLIARDEVFQAEPINILKYTTTEIDA